MPGSGTGAVLKESVPGVPQLVLNLSDEHITAEMNDHHPYALRPFSKRIRLDRADAW